jgi:diadenosine tetraphosphate (Ap4A) HIT family hydrolase
MTSRAPSRADVASPPCVLCRPRLETPIVRTSTFWRVALNRNQNQLGKAIIVLRRHLEEVALLSPEEWDALHAEVRWTTERLRRAFSPDHFNYSFLQNQDRHVHLHVIPRYIGTREVAGVEFSDRDYPDRYLEPPADERIVGADVLAAIASAFRA